MDNLVLPAQVNCRRAWPYAFARRTGLFRAWITRKRLCDSGDKGCTGVGVQRPVLFRSLADIYQARYLAGRAPLLASPGQYLLNPGLFKTLRQKSSLNSTIRIERLACALSTIPAQELHSCSCSIALSRESLSPGVDQTYLGPASKSVGDSLGFGNSWERSEERTLYGCVYCAQVKESGRN